MMIYFDNNATSLLDPEIGDRMSELGRQQLANPSSQHQAGRQARQVLESARDQILQCVDARTKGMESDQLIFTSGGTEANNLALFGISQNRPGVIVVSSIEHPSVLGAADKLKERGRAVTKLAVDENGVVDLKHLGSILEGHKTSPISMVSIMAANNETGVLQPIHSAARLCQTYGVPIHTDAVQWLGKEPLSFQDFQVDAMTITAHKIHGPVGVGALIAKRGLQIEPQAFGGFQQLGLRPGTESPVLADAMSFAIRKAIRTEDRSSQLRVLRDSFESKLQSAVPAAIIVGRESERLPHVTSVAFPGLDRQAIQLALDLRGIACSTGSACASGSSQPSHVLVAMNLSPDVVKGGVRFSLSIHNTLEEVDRVVEALAIVAKQLGGKR